MQSRCNPKTSLVQYPTFQCSSIFLKEKNWVCCSFSRGNAKKALHLAIYQAYKNVIDMYYRICGLQDTGLCFQQSYSVGLDLIDHSSSGFSTTWTSIGEIVIENRKIDSFGSINCCFESMSWTSKYRLDQSFYSDFFFRFKLHF